MNKETTALLSAGAQDGPKAHESIPTAIPVANVVGAPGPVDMTREEAELDRAEGLLFRERTYLSQLMFGACEKRTNMLVAAWHRGMQPLGPRQHLPDERFVEALSARSVMDIREESTCLCRYCCHQFRELELGSFVPRGRGALPGEDAGFLGEGDLLSGVGWPANETPSFVFHRPFRCTLACCCAMLNPQEMQVRGRGDRPLGGTIQDWHCYMCCWPVREFRVADEAGNLEYTVRVPFACADGCLNCCAPTCFNPVYHMPILEARSRAPVGSIQNHWPGCNVRGLLCAGNANNSYRLEFPAGATVAQKARLVSALFLINFNFFEKRADQKQ